MKLLCNSFEDGTSNYTADQLMLLMENKYRVLTGEWGTPSKEQVKIVALTPQVNVFKKELATKGKTKKQEPRTEGNKDKGNKGDSKWDWQKKPPTNNQLEKTVNSKTYYWCPNHGKEGQWIHHKSEECHLKPATTMNHQAASITATDLSAPANDKSTIHTLQHQVNVTVFNTNNSDFEDDEGLTTQLQASWGWLTVKGSFHPFWEYALVATAFIYCYIMEFLLLRYESSDRKMSKLNHM